METKVIFFSAESDRNLVEREFHGKTFGSISEVKNMADALDVEYLRFTNIEDFIVALNDEDYPSDEWVALVTITTEEI